LDGSCLRAEAACSGFRKKAANNRLKSSHELNRNEHSEASAANPQSAIRLVRHGVSHGGKPQLAATPAFIPPPSDHSYLSFTGHSVSVKRTLSRENADFLGGQ